MTTDKKEKYTLILQAALKVFAKNGYHNSKVATIAREAGVADGTIYLYFKSKEDILVCLFREQLGSLVDKFTTGVHQTGNAKEAIMKMCEVHFTELEKNLDLAYVTQIELRQSTLALRKEIGQALKPYLLLIEAIIRQGIEEGIFRANLDVKLVRHLLFGAMDEVVTSWLISGQKYSLADQAKGTVEFFLSGLENKA